MTIELRTLRVSAEMDASKYVAAGQQKVAADKAMAVSGKEAAAGIAAVGGAATATDTKVSASVNVMERLSRQYVDGYGSASRAATAIAALSREIDKNGYDAARTTAILEGIYRKHGQLADAATFAARGQNELASAIATTTARMQQQESAAASAGAQIIRLNDYARLRAQQDGAYFQQDLNARMGIGRQANSAEASASAFMAAGVGGNRLNRGQIQNLSFQANDIATMALMGAPLTQIAASQGGQIVQLLQQNDGGVRGSLDAIKSGAASAASSVVSFLGPVGMIATGFGLAAAAAGAFYLLTREKSKTLTEVLDSHEAAVRKIGDAYGYAARQAKIMPSIDGRSGDLQSAASAEQLRLSLQRESEQIVLDNIMPVGSFYGPKDYIRAEFQPFEEALRSLQATTKAGAPGIAEFRRLVSERWALDPLNKDLTTSAGKLMDITNGAMQAVQYLGQLERMRLARVDEYRLYGMSRVAGPEAKAAADALKLRLDGQSDAAMQAEIRARTFAERMEAVRLQAANGDPIGRSDRVRVAELQERTRQEVELRDAARSRAEAQRDSIEQMKIEALTIGKTAGEIETLNTGYRLFVELREQSERTGLPITDEALQNAREFAKAMGAAADANARLRVADDLKFERAQLFRSPQEQQIASRLRNTGIGMDSPEAEAMRQNNRIADYRELGVDLLSGIRDGVLSGSENIGESIANAVVDAGMNYVRKMTDRLIEDAVTSGMQLLGLDASGIGARAVTDMMVTAAVVNINGTPIGAGVGDAATRLLSGANSNDPWSGARMGAPVGAVGRSSPSQGNPAGTWGDMAAANMGSRASAYRDAIASIESAGSGDYSAIGPTHKTLGRALGRYQVMEANIGPWSRQALGREISPSQFLANPSMQDAIFDNKFGGYVSRFGERGAAQAWFGGEGSVGKLGRSDVLGTTVGGYGDKFIAALEKAAPSVERMATSSIEATQGLGQFGTGLDQFGKSLASSMTGAPAAPGVGGGGGLLSWLFGGGGTATASTGFMTSPRAYAGGTEFAPPGWAWVGEEGPELMRMRGGETIRNARASQQMASPTVNVVTNVHNNAGVQIREERKDDGKGGIRQDIYVEKAVARAMSRPGSEANQTLSQMGARAPLVRR